MSTYVLVSDVIGLQAELLHLHPHRLAPMEGTAKQMSIREDLLESLLSTS